MNCKENSGKENVSFFICISPTVAWLLYKKKGLANILGQRWRKFGDGENVKKLQVEIIYFCVPKDTVSLISYFIYLFFLSCNDFSHFLFSCVTKIPKMCCLFFCFLSPLCSKRSEDFPRKTSSLSVSTYFSLFLTVYDLEIPRNMTRVFLGL